MPLPTDIGTGTFDGHLGHHNEIHERLESSDLININEPPPVIHVSPTGDDANDGRWDKPKLTPAAGLAAVPAGGIVQVIGTHTLTASLIVTITKRGVTFRGVGYWGTSGLGATRIIIPSGMTGLILKTDRCKVQDIHFEGQAGSLNGVVCQNAGRSIMERVRCSGFGDNGFLLDAVYDGEPAGNNNLVQFFSCMGDANTDHGFAAVFGNDNNAIELWGCEGKGNGKSGVMVKGDSWRIMGGIYINNTEYGIQLAEDADSGTSDNTLMMMPWLESNTLGGVFGSTKASPFTYYGMTQGQDYLGTADTGIIVRPTVDTAGNIVGQLFRNHTSVGKKGVAIGGRTGTTQAGVVAAKGDGADVDLELRAKGLGAVRVGVSSDKVGFFDAAGTAKPTITGSRGGNAALADLLTKLATMGLITNSTT